MRNLSSDVQIRAFSSSLLKSESPTWVDSLEKDNGKAKYVRFIFIIVAIRFLCYIFLNMQERFRKWVYIEASSSYMYARQ